MLMGRGEAFASAHRMRGWVHALFALLILLLCPAPAAAAAQLQSQPVAAVLTNVRLISETPSESRFELAFDPKATTFAPIASQPTQPSIGFALTTRGPHAVQPSNMKGLVRSISFEQDDTVLILRFGVTQAATVAGVQTGGRTIEITITNGKAKQSTSTNYADQSAEAPLPPAYQQPEAYALVLLKYADVSEVVGLLTDGQTVKSNDVFIPSEPAFGSNSLTGTTYQPQQQTQAPGASDEPLGQSVDATIGIDRRLNAIWLKGSPEQIEQLKQEIAAIDIPVDSVVLETQFVELTEQGLRALGIEFNNANGQLGVVTFQTGAFEPIIGQGSHLTSVQFQAALFAQIQKGNGRIVSRPRISAQSGSTAKIITGDALPILTSIALSGVNGVSQQVQYVNVGVTLQIAPRVSGDGWVSSHVFAVVSSVTGTSQGYPTISQREAETSATVRDGDSFVIGGLTQDETISTKSKIPLLGDIPIVGEVFRNQRTTTSKTELYIIVTPHIVHRIGTSPNVVPGNAPLYSPPTPTAPPGPPNPPRAAPEHR